jgi:hypothetical protein
MNRPSALLLLWTTGLRPLAASFEGFLDGLGALWTAESAEQLKAVCVVRDPDSSAQTAAAWENWKAKNASSLNELKSLRMRLQAEWRRVALDASSKAPLEERLLAMTAIDTTRTIAAGAQFQKLAVADDSAAMGLCAAARASWSAPTAQATLEERVGKVRVDAKRELAVIR